ncbi:hypothetical protein HBH70_036300 [Parastagonospora nodorum]|nr:hypothetical protein HBH51_001720 [Parastagonospora nodorum]KAH4109620.1 hypothetical protein HBH46_030360 [Parastagonospora nodorum]KAH4114253.1 hypothetical protein HBH47_199260 [Parastagonospora nodorum]KAH4309501.1 hypothetical protein HBI01_038250 [Parastagonospora nodorum]KAH4314488.1 hypothetical protein HBI02_060540 [Parastagonospora nodorum]
MAPIEGKCSAFCTFFVGILKQMLKGAPAAANRDRFANDQNRHGCCDRGSNLDTQDTYQDGLVVTKRLLADHPHLPHDVFEVSSAASTQSWYIDDTGAHTNMELPALLRLPDENYAAQEKELLGMVRRSAKGFVLLWVGP